MAMASWISRSPFMAASSIILARSSRTPSRSCWVTATGPSRRRVSSLPAAVLTPWPWATSTAMASWIWRWRTLVQALNESPRSRSSWPTAMAPSSRHKSSLRAPVLLGNGDGTFQAAQNFGAGSGPAFVAVDDFNGDGKLDMAVPDYDSTTVSVLINTTASQAVTLLSLTLNPSTVTGGSSSTGTVTLSAPAPGGGAVVSLSSNTTGVATVPPIGTVPAGGSTGTFTRGPG